jgi:hypothetical protein
MALDEISALVVEQVSQHSLQTLLEASSLLLKSFDELILLLLFVGNLFPISVI